MVEFIPDRHIRLARFADYSPRPEPPNGYGGARVAYLDEIVFLPVPDTSVRIAKPSGWTAAVFNHRSPLFSDRRLRQALLAALSFPGVGVPPYIPSWGNILTGGRPFMHLAPWLTLFPGLAIMLAVLGLNLFGDGLPTCWIRACGACARAEPRCDRSPLNGPTPGRPVARGVHIHRPALWTSLAPWGRLAIDWNAQARAGVRRRSRRWPG